MLFTNKFIEKKKKKEGSTCGHGLLERRACGIETKTHKQAILTYKWKFACCILSLKVMCTVAY